VPALLLTILNNYMNNQEQIEKAYQTLIEMGVSPEVARISIETQLAQMENMPYTPSEDDGRMENMPYAPSEDDGIMKNMPYSPSESQDVPEYYDPRLQLLSPEDMQEEMKNPSMPGYAGGGIANLRQQYGLGSIVKSIGKTVGKIASSDIGKAALLYAGTAGLGSLAAGGGFGSLLSAGTYAPSMVGSNLLTGLTRGASALGFTKGGGGLELGKGILGKGAALLGGSALLSSLFGSKEQAQEMLRRNPAAVKSYLAQYYRNINENREVTDDEVNKFVEEQTKEYASGGRVGYAYGSSVDQGIMAAPQIANQMGMPVGNPRQNQEGIMELDYRQEGGFVPPIGLKEKEDDVPAMLSNNEFVFTADAVRNAGDGDVDLGARKLYSQMKTLENGGSV
jgi:hypothetical protein